MTGCDLDQFDMVLTLNSQNDWISHAFITYDQHEITTLGNRGTCLTPEH